MLGRTRDNGAHPEGRALLARKKADAKVDERVVERITNPEWEPILREASAKYKIPIALLRAIMAVESAGIPSAGKGKGKAYKGLMQAGKTDSHLDPATSIAAGAETYAKKANYISGKLRAQLDQLGITSGDFNDVEYASIVVLAYNAGEAVVIDAVKEAARAGEVKAWLEERYYAPALLKWGSFAHTSAQGRIAKMSEPELAANHLKLTGKEIATGLSRKQMETAVLGAVGFRQQQMKQERKRRSLEQAAQEFGELIPLCARAKHRNTAPYAEKMRLYYTHLLAQENGAPAGQILKQPPVVAPPQADADDQPPPAVGGQQKQPAAAPPAQRPANAGGGVFGALANPLGTVGAGIEALGTQMDAMARGEISDSVGRRGANHPPDVLVVQSLLQRAGAIAGKPEVEALGDAIAQFQADHKLMKKPDGKVDPGRGTLKALREAASAGPAAQATPPAPPAPTPARPGAAPPGPAPAPPGPAARPGPAPASVPASAGDSAAKQLLASLNNPSANAIEVELDRLQELPQTRDNTEEVGRGRGDLVKGLKTCARNAALARAGRQRGGGHSDGLLLPAGQHRSRPPTTRARTSTSSKKRTALAHATSPRSRSHSRRSASRRQTTRARPIWVRSSGTSRGR